MHQPVPHLRKLTLFMCLVFITVTGALAQKTDRLKLKPTDGADLASSLKSKAYFYPDFKNGKVSFVNGVTSTSTLNYNMLSGEVEFINSRKDTLALADIHYVKLITIEADTFYYNQDDNSLLRLVSAIGSNKILARERYELTDIKNVGAFGTESSTSSPNSSSRNQVLGNTQNRLKQNETLVYSLKTTYYFSNNDRFVPASKTNAVKLSPKHKEEIQRYIKDKKTSFSNEEQLKELLKHIASI